MRKLIAVLGAVALCASLAPAEQKTQAQLSDAVYDIQMGKDSVNQIQALRVKGATVIGGAATVGGAVTATSFSGSGAGLTALPASSLSGSPTFAALTTTSALTNQGTMVTVGLTLNPTNGEAIALTTRALFILTPAGAVTNTVVTPVLNGSHVTLIGTSNTTTFAKAANLSLGSATRVLGAGDTLSLISNGPIWLETAYSDNTVGP